MILGENLTLYKYIRKGLSKTGEETAGDTAVFPHQNQTFPKISLTFLKTVYIIPSCWFTTEEAVKKLTDSKKEQINFEIALDTKKDCDTITCCQTKGCRHKCGTPKQENDMT